MRLYMLPRRRIACFLAFCVLFAEGVSMAQPLDSIIIQVEPDTIITRYIFEDYGLPRVDSTGLITLSGDYVRTEEAVDSLWQAMRSSRPLTSPDPSLANSGETVGKIPMQTSVSPMGARLINIPIQTSPGWKNVPAVSLSYSSQAGNGRAGYGWDISGIPAISVRNKTPIFDGSNQHAVYSSSASAYSLDGVPLLPSDRVAGYPLETLHGNIQVRKHLLDDGTPAYFTASYPNGSQAVFGYESAQEPDYIYPITKLTDVYGHEILFEYECYDNCFYIRRITYGNDASLLFDYVYRGESDAYQYSIAGKSVGRTQRLLKQIRSQDGESEIATYTLTHQQTDGVQALTKVECSSGGHSLCPLTFSYENAAAISNSAFSQLDQLSLTRAYDNPEQKLIHKRGRLRPGRFDDALIVYPDKKNYEQLEHKTMLYSSVRAYRYGSQYSADDILLCYPDVKVSGAYFEMTAGEGFQTLDAVDIDADGVDELVKINSAEMAGSRTFFSVTIYSFGSQGDPSSQEFSFILEDGTSNWYYKNPAKCWYKYGRFRGDGEYMLLILSRDGSKTALVDLNAGLKLYEASLVPVSDEEVGNILVADFENDGKDDLCFVDTSGLKVYTLSSGNQLTYRTTYYGAAKKDLCSLPGTPYDGITGDTVPTEHYLTDLNGDGFLDIVSYPLSLSIPGYGPLQNYMWHIARFNGSRFYAEQTPLCYKRNDVPVHFFDADEDGLPEMLISSGAQSSLLHNEHGQFVFPPSESVLPLTSGSYVVPCRVGTRMGSAVVSVADGSHVSFYGSGVSHKKRRLLTSMDDGFGNIVHDTHGDICSEDGSYLSNSQSFGSFNGYMRYPIPLYVVNQSWTTVHGETVSDLTYLYWDAIVHNKGLGFCGFRQVNITDNVAGERMVRKMAPDHFGVVTREEKRRLDAPDKYAWADYSYQSYQSHGVYLPRLQREESFSYLTYLQSRTDYTYDALGFPTTVATSRWNGVGPEKKETVQRTYQHSISASKYILGGVTEESLIREGDWSPSLSWKEKTVTTLDTLFRPQSSHRYVGEYGRILIETGSTALLNGPGGGPEVQPYIPNEPLEPGEPGEPNPNWPGTGFVPGEDEQYLDSTLYEFRDASLLVESIRWEYDSHGNVTREEHAPYGATVFTGKSWTYDGNGRYLTGETDELGHTTTYGSYNKFGKPGTSTDWRGHVTALYYDAWGAPVRRENADGSAVETQKRWSASGEEGLYCVVECSSNAPEKKVYYDALDREVMSGEKRFDGSWLWRKTEYDGEGRVSRVSLPYKGTAPAYWTVNSYDDYGRLLSVVEGASGKQSTWAYDGASVTTVREGILSTKTTDANGALVSVTDGGGTISYTLRDDGQPSAVTAPGDVVTFFEYDGYGRRTKMTDPSAGVQTDAYTWNADGTSVRTHTNANGSVTTRADRFGRTTGVERAGTDTVAYYYNTAGLLERALSTGGVSKRYAYDSLDRVLSVRDSLPDGYWLQQEYSYGPQGRLERTSYTAQGGPVTTEHYRYANGHQSGIRLQDSTVVWSLVSENGQGRVSEIQTGSISREYGYSPSGLPTFRKMGGGTLQHFAYQFDPLTGNLLSRSDVLRSKTETFAYDTLGRLVGMGARTVTYDSKGNLGQMPDIGQLYYDDADHPYRATAYMPETTSGWPFHDQTVSYTGFNRPLEIQEGAARATFAYGLADERVKMTLRTGSSVTLTRYYLGGRYEMDETPGGGTKERLYLGGDPYSAPVVYVRENGGAWTLLNIGRDYLGSITHIATEDGTLLAEYSYDPWGRMRIPQTQVLYAGGTEPELLLGRGYTGHEHLRQFGLINMNARLYDPYLGRFLSPDPYVQAPDFSQNFNRYSYALNNPLKYTDESGEFLGTILTALLRLPVAFIEGIIAPLFVSLSDTEKAGEMFENA